MRELYEAVAGEVDKVVVGQERDAATAARRARARRPRAARGRRPASPRRCSPARPPRALGLDFRRVQFTPDMLPSDVTGTMALRGGELVVPARAGVPERPARRRDQPHAAEDAGRAAGGDAGGPGDGRRRSRTRCPTRSSCSPRRTRSSTRAPTRCPRRSSTASWCTSRSATRTRPTRSARCSGSRAAASAPATSTTCGRWRAPRTLRAARAEVDATRVDDEVVGYVVAVVRRTRELPSVALGASPRAAVHLLGAAKAAARLAGRDYVTPDDVARMAVAGARATGSCSPPRPSSSATTPTDAVRTALGDVPVPR